MFSLSTFSREYCEESTADDGTMEQDSLGKVVQQKDESYNEGFVSRLAKKQKPKNN